MYNPLKPKLNVYEIKEKQYIITRELDLEDLLIFLIPVLGQICFLTNAFNGFKNYLDKNNQLHCSKNAAQIFYNLQYVENALKEFKQKEEKLRKEQSFKKRKIDLEKEKAIKELQKD